MKTKEELEQIKEKYTELNKKLADLSEDELEQVSGGGVFSVTPSSKTLATTIENGKSVNVNEVLT